MRTKVRAHRRKGRIVRVHTRNYGFRPGDRRQRRFERESALREWRRWAELPKSEQIKFQETTGVEIKNPIDFRKKQNVKKIKESEAIFL